MIFKSFCIIIVLFLNIKTTSFANNKVKYVEDIQADIMKILHNSQDDNRTKQLIIDKYAKYIDFEWNAKNALGRYFLDLTDEEKNNYICEYACFISYSWLPKLDFQKVKGVKINILNNTIPLNNKFNDENVVIKITLPDGLIYTVNLRIREMLDNSFKILNIDVEGVDLAMMYRYQFESLINSNGNSAKFLLNHLIATNNKNITKGEFNFKLPPEYKCPTQKLIDLRHTK